MACLLFVFCKNMLHEKLMQDHDSPYYQKYLLFLYSKCHGYILGRMIPETPLNTVNVSAIYIQFVITQTNTHIFTLCL